MPEYKINANGRWSASAVIKGEDEDDALAFFYEVHLEYKNPGSVHLDSINVNIKKYEEEKDE